MELQRNRIYNMDCRVGLKMMHAQGMTVDCVITDPPYIMRYKSRRRKNKHSRFCSEIIGDDDPQLIADIMPLLYDVMKDDTPLYMFCSPVYIDLFMTEVKRCFTVKNLIVWDKGNHTAGDLSAQYGRRYELIIYANKGRALFNKDMPRYEDIWFMPKVSEKKRIHQNEKPSSIISRIILQHTKQGQLVLDPFMGSFKTASAAYKLQRDYIGFEIDGGYFDLGMARLQAEQAQISFLYGREVA